MAGAYPVLQSGWTTAGDTTASTTRVIAKPSGVSEGDLLIIVCGSDDNTGSPVFQTKSGWTLEVNGGDDISDCKIGFYWKIAGASEPANETITQSNSHEIWAFYARITGHDAADPIGTKHVVRNLASSAVHELPPTAPGSNWPDKNYSLMIFCWSFDGGDGGATFNHQVVSSITDINAGTTGNDAMGNVSTANFRMAGRKSGTYSSTSVELVSTAADGSAFFWININPAVPGGFGIMNGTALKDIRFIINQSKNSLAIADGIEL